MSRYRLLFALDVRHAYFSSGWCDGVRVRPTPDCERLMRRYRLLFKPTAQGAEVYFDEAAQQRGMPGSLRPFDARESLSFTLESAFSPLVNYTAIDARPRAAPGVSLYAFDNVGGGNATFDGVVYPLLHPLGRPFALGALACVPRRFRFQADAPVSQVTVRDAVSGAVVLGPRALAPPTKQVALALPHASEGRYILSAPGAADWPFFLTDAQVTGVFAMATIHPRAADAQASAAPCIDANGGVDARRYTIVLDARSVTWRYLIVPHAAQASEGWRIDAAWRRAARDDTADPPGFVRADAPAKVGERDAVMFTSTRALRVAERPGDVMTLKLDGGRLPDPVALPFPDVTRGVSAYRPPAAVDMADRPSEGDAADIADVFVYL